MSLSRLLPSFIKRKKPRHSKTIRILHWSYAPAVIISSISGFYIYRPPGIVGFRTMSSARKTHFLAQYALIFSYLARVLYSLKDKNYKEIVPERRTFANIPKFLKYEFFMTEKEPKSAKYNSGQKLLFIGFALLIPIQIITGLSLYKPDSWQNTSKIAGGLNPLRKAHYLAALTVASMSLGHLYFVLTHGLKKLKSIFTGYE